MRYKSKRRYRNRRYKKRKSSKKYIARVVRKVLSEDSEMVSTHINHKWLFNDNPAAPLIVRPLDPPVKQGTRKYVADHATDTWGYRAVARNYQTGEVPYEVMLGNKMRRKKCTVVIEGFPRLAYTTSAFNTRWYQDDFVDYSSTGGGPFVNSYGVLAGKIMVWIWKAPKGLLESDTLTYVEEYGNRLCSVLWGDNNDFFVNPPDRTKVTILKKVEWNYHMLKPFRVKIRVKKYGGNFTIPTQGNGALEAATRPNSGNCYMAIFISGTNKITNTAPTPDRDYVCIPNLSVTIHNTLTDY